MSSNIYTEQGKNIRKTWFLMTTFFVLIVALGSFISFYYQSSAILYGAILFSVAMNIASYWYSDKIVLSMHKAKPVTREVYFDLYTVTENLSITAGLPMPKLYVIEESAPNAFATGRDKEHAVVCVTTGLLALLDRQELEGVIAHEISHIGNRDILLSTVVVVLAGFVSIISHMFLRTLHIGGNSNNRNGGGALAILGIVLALLAPLGATLIQLAVSRKREFLADADGALLTRYPEGLARALEKITSSSIPMQTANNATAHLFIANPFAKKVGFSKLFMTHPPTEERVRALLGK